MSKLISPITLETTFGSYVVDELIGEGGAGRVYGGVDPEQAKIAIKVLASERASADKRRRFKNEITFLVRNTHPNIVAVLDHGVSQSGKVLGPFYVMKRHDYSLRNLVGKTAPKDVLAQFSQIIDGVEAAHLKNVVHRDLKPENILCNHNDKTLAIADFGIARFAEDLLTTLVETSPAQRLANFTYAAPEQRIPGQAVTASADIYALGLILNEMFTGSVPLGIGYPSIESKSKDFGFLDPIVSKMISQAPAARPTSISEVKSLIQRHQAEAVSLQRLSTITSTVVKADAIDDPLAYEPPKVVTGNWNNGRLTLKLDRSVTQEWVNSFRTIGNYTSVMGIPPSAFTFQGSDATVGVDSNSAQQVIDYFKDWLPKATRGLNTALTENARRAEAHRLEKLKQEQRAEEERLKANRALKF